MMRRWTHQDLARFREGRHFDLHELLGAHWLGPRTVFRVWAPDATRVSVVGAFNHGDGQACPMARVLGYATGGLDPEWVEGEQALPGTVSCSYINQTCSGLIPNET